MSMSVYHVTVPTTDGVAVVGACASGKTEAARLVVERLAVDGYAERAIRGDRQFAVRSTVRVAGQGAWTPGDVMVYSILTPRVSAP